MPWHRFATQARPDEFGVFCETLARVVGLDLRAVPAGLSSVEGEFGPGMLAWSPAKQFMALQWFSSQGPAEAYCLLAPSMGLRVGYAVWPVTPVDCGVPVELNAWLSSEHKVVASPQFITLLSLLVSEGAAVVTNLSASLSDAEENDYLRQLLLEQSELLRQARAAVRALKQGLAKSVENGSELSVFEAEPETLSEWCLAHENRVVVLPRARNGFKKSVYGDPSLVFTALGLLAGVYLDYRNGVVTQESLEEILLSHGLRLARSTVPSVAGEQGEAYYVSWGGRRRMLAWHLLKGGGRDERFCFRLYFFFDEESRRVVVGSMPAHLDNSLS